MLDQCDVFASNETHNGLGTSKELNHTMQHSPSLSIKPPKDNFVDDHLAELPRVDPGPSNDNSVQTSLEHEV